LPNETLSKQNGNTLETDQETGSGFAVPRKVVQKHRYVIEKQRVEGVCLRKKNDDMLADLDRAGIVILTDKSVS